MTLKPLTAKSIKCLKRSTDTVYIPWIDTVKQGRKTSAKMTQSTKIPARKTLVRKGHKRERDTIYK